MRPVGNWSLIGCIIVSLSMKMSVFCGRAVMLEVGGQKKGCFSGRHVPFRGTPTTPFGRVGAAALMRLVSICTTPPGLFINIIPQIQEPYTYHPQRFDNL